MAMQRSVSVPDPRFSPSKGVAGAFAFILSETMFFLGLFFAWNYFAVTAKAWPPANIPRPTMVLPIINSIVMLVSLATMTLADASVTRLNRPRWFLPLMVITALLGLLFTGIQIVEFGQLAFNPTSHTFGSAFFVVLFFHFARVIGGVILMGIVYARGLLGLVTPARYAALRACTMYWWFIGIVWYVVFYVLYLTWPVAR
jgi:cytochrome c oxidase subunit III